MQVPEKTLTRFFDKIYYGLDGCWYWTGGHNKRKNGFSHCKGNKILSHRLSYIIHKGQIPEGMVICHTCDNGICVNPDHLFLGTQSDNITDMMHKSRGYGQKLNPIYVKIIRECLSVGFRDSAIAKYFNVNRSTVANIKRNHLWPTEKHF